MDLFPPGPNLYTSMIPDAVLKVNLTSHHWVQGEGFEAKWATDKVGQGGGSRKVRVAVEGVGNELWGWM